MLPNRGLLQRRVDGEAFPDLLQQGYELIGGRRAEVGDDRDATTLNWTKRGRALDYTIVSGTGNADDDAATEARAITTSARKVWITMQPIGGRLVLKTERRKRTVLVTVRPAPSRLTQDLRRVMLRG
ncbi:MAG: hypothetical protein JWO90_1722 [Solirubrobacterales bacterium]|nr:hypothetical protein [Solirubrobacterales bacterium]